MIYIRDIIEKFNGTLVCGNMNLEIKNISKDTRTIKEGDTVLFKGSHGIKLNNKVNYLINNK